MGKRGPAPKGEYADKSKVVSTRMTARTRAGLEAAAKRSGRSLSQEMEFRLRRTFDEDELTVLIFGSREVFALMRLISSAMDLAAKNVATIRGLGPTDWLSDPWAYSQACWAAARVLGAFRPEGDPAPPQGSKQGLSLKIETIMLNIIGASNANAMLDAVRLADAKGDDLQRLGARIKDGLGAIAERVSHDFNRTTDDPAAAAPSAKRKRGKS